MDLIKFDTLSFIDKFYLLQDYLSNSYMYKSKNNHVMLWAANNEKKINLLIEEIKKQDKYFWTDEQIDALLIMDKLGE